MPVSSFFFKHRARRRLAFAQFALRQVQREFGNLPDLYVHVPLRDNDLIARGKSRFIWNSDGIQIACIDRRGIGNPMIKTRSPGPGAHRCRRRINNQKVAKKGIRCDHSRGSMDEP